MGKIYDALKKAAGERELRKEKETPVFKSDVLQEPPQGRETVKTHETPRTEQTPSQKHTYYQGRIEQTEVTSFNPHLIALTDPTSYISEQYKTLRAKLHKIREEEGKRVFVISSSTILEGKTLTSVNLAVAMAQDLDKKTILIDGDLRKGSVHSYLGIAKKPGLADLIRHNGSFDLSVVKKVGNLSVLTTGSLPANPAELLGSRRMRELIEVLKSSYEFIIVDSAPLIPIVDARILLNIADGMLFVVKAGKTNYTVLERAIQSVDSNKILGVVLNKIKLDRWSYGYYYYYSDYQVKQPGERVSSP